MSSDSIYAQLRSWYTGLRYLRRFKHLENTAVGDTARSTPGSSYGEGNGLGHTLHHDLLASAHIINRPWPAPQQALRNTLSNASLNKRTNRSRSDTLESGDPVDQDRDVADSSPKQPNKTESKDGFKEPITPQPSPGRSFTRPARGMSQSSSVQSDRPDLSTVKSNKLQRRLERGKSSSTVAQAVIPTSPSFLAPPVSKRRHTGGNDTKPSDVEGLLSLIARDRDRPESANLSMSPDPQSIKKDQSAPQPDNGPSEESQTLARDSKDSLPGVVPRDATSRLEQSKPTEIDERELTVSKDPRVEEHHNLNQSNFLDQGLLRSPQDDNGDSSQPEAGSELLTTLESDLKTKSEAEIAKKVQNTEPSIQQAESRIYKANMGKRASRPRGIEQQTNANIQSKDQPASSSSSSPAVTRPGLPIQGSQTSQSKDASQNDEQPENELSAAEEPQKAPMVINQDSRHRGTPTIRTNYLSYVDTSYLYDPPPLGPAGFFPKEAFPQVEPLHLF